MRSKQLNAAYSLLLVSLFASCEKDYLPQDRESLSYDMVMTNTVFNPVLGRNYLMDGSFSVGNSSQPLDFEIQNMRTFAGNSAPEFDSAYAVKVWKEAYTGDETSLAEIEAKREIQYRKLFEVYPHAGIFKMWSPANSTFIKTLPDSCYLFDLKVSSNSGGSMYFKDLKLQPYRERDYEPNSFDEYTGNASTAYVRPSGYSNLIGDSTGQTLKDVRVTFHRNGEGNKLSFKFLGKNNQTINPDKFATTDWTHLVHGFNMVKNEDSVSYDVAYPIPLTETKTNYTDYAGSKAVVSFSFSRIGYGGSSQSARVGLNFSIYKEGNWTITFQFYDDDPKFTDD